MLTKEDLMKFVVPGKYKIGMPWSKGDVSYFTNGHVIIRVPCLSDVPDNPEAPDAKYVFDQAPPAPDKWVSVPDVTPISLKCDECGGQGRKFRNFEGYDWSRECDNCNGLGKTTKVEGYEIGGTKFDINYLFLLHHLPNCQIAPIDSVSPTWIKFDGGDGLIMPMGF